MLRCASVRKREELRAAASASQRTDTITLDREQRYRRRIVLATDGGLSVLLDLPEATYLADGDALELDNGQLVVVKAAVEDLYEIHAQSAAELARIAWHIGNRHTPCEITPEALYIAPDHVLADMVTGLGGHVHQVRRPFEPEGGAYGGHGALAAGHHHEHAHEHQRSHHSAADAAATENRRHRAFDTDPTEPRHPGGRVRDG